MENVDHTSILYFSHGGGPLPLIGDGSHQKMIEFMQNLPGKIQKPSAILVFSAHWEESEIGIIGKYNAPLFYDYYGFPEETYEIKYPIKGDAELVSGIQSALGMNGIASHIEMKRGYDHGVFIPLKIMYPEADIPVIQISLKKGLNPLDHILLGNALRRLKESNLLIIGSGFSFHNMGAFSFDSSMNEIDKANNEFQDWLIEKCTGNYTCEQTEKALVSWETAPYARYCHPREEHLLPLHVCYGAAQKPAQVIFDDYIAGKRSVAFLWEN